MFRKGLGLLLLGGLAAFAVGQWQDIERFIKIRRLSLGAGHPELVPAGGRVSYPQDARDGAAEGEGDFDSASRGGPASRSVAVRA
jgi:hypothetical protein